LPPEHTTTTDFLGALTPTTASPGSLRRMNSRTAHHHRIDYIELSAADLSAVKSFYTGAFAWTFTDWGDDYTSFEDGRLGGGFHRKDDPKVAGGPLVILYSTSLEASSSAVVFHGGTIVEPIFPFPGGRRFHFADPAGNVLAVWSDQPAPEVGR